MNETPTLTIRRLEEPIEVPGAATVEWAWIAEGVAFDGVTAWSGAPTRERALEAGLAYCDTHGIAEHDVTVTIEESTP